MQNSELQLAAMAALKDYMGVKPNESVLIVTDETRREIGLALLEAGQHLAQEAFLVEMKSREANGQEPPKAIADMMKQVDVVVCPTLRSLTHTNARREAAALGVRVGTMPGITIGTMARCLSADAKRIVDLSDKFVARLQGVKEIRVVTEKGTDITMPIEGRKVLPSTGVLTEKGASGNMPSGEVYLAPVEGKSQGVVVVDGSMAGIGMISTPIRIEVKDGYAEQITGGEEADRLIGLLEKAGRDSRAVAEFGVGTNYKAILTGDILEDEKVMGTIHIAFGNNVSMGGTITVSSHLDGLVKDPDVYFDGVLVMEKGKSLV